MEHDERVICPRCKSGDVEEHQEAGDLPWWECLDCGLCWDGSEAGAVEVGG